MSIDLEELKRLYAPTIVPDENRRMARATFEEYMHDAFPTILARLEAAQRLRDAIIALDVNKQYLLTKKIGDMVAAFDKETE